jgi:hypothetical protein
MLEKQKGSSGYGNDHCDNYHARFAYTYHGHLSKKAINRAHRLGQCLGPDSKQSTPMLRSRRA